MLLDKWAKGETFTVAYHRYGNSIHDLSRLFTIASSVPYGVSIAAEGDLKWIDRDLYLWHGQGLGGGVIRDKWELWESLKEERALLLEDAVDPQVSGGMLYNLDLKQGIGSPHGALERAVRIFEAAGRINSLWFSSTDLELLSAAHEVNPDIPNALVSLLTLWNRFRLHPSTNPKKLITDVYALDYVDILSSPPKGTLIVHSKFDLLFVPNKVLDLITTIPKTEDERIHKEAQSLSRHSKLSFPGDLNEPWEVPKYFVEGVAGVYVNVHPEMFPKSEFPESKFFQNL